MTQEFFTEAAAGASMKRPTVSITRMRWDVS
jgi:hypothetical protein